MTRVIEGWWEFPRWSDEYEQGTDRYIEHALATKSQGDEICCPCTLCDYRYWHYGNVVKDHIICNGFIPRTNDLLEVRKDIHSEKEMFENNEPINMNDGMQELLHDTFREGPNEEAKKFLNLIEEGQEELFPGCKTFSKLSFIIRLFIYKCDHKLSNVAFSALLDLLRELLPDAKLPSSFHEANKMLKLLGLDYIKIDACPNKCMLYWEEHANATCCHVCGTPRWKSNGKNKDMGEPNRKTHKIPEKVLRYFPIKKRLQRLYMCGDIAKMMTWHAEGREKDGLLRHPADGQSWKDFDKIYPKFAEEPRNVRLGLATDGFNPFHTMSIVHSTWPVILINYNLPPWMATKSEFLMLSLLIPGPSSPGNSIDIYLQPLVKDLEDLWEFGLETYDASSNKMFDMHVALMSTINDFPAYAMLSGWSTKGKLACPCCHYETNSKWLDHSRKECYMDNRVFLDSTHPWRHNRRKFNGKIEERLAPNRLNGVEIEELLRDYPNKFGKKDKRRKQVQDDPNPWRKFPILFRLPYWKHCSLRHNLDVMHIEKNVFDNVIGTLLDIPGKTKDHEAARRDLKVLGIMPELQIKELEDGSEQIPPARFWMTLEQKRLFCKTIKNAKLPKGYASNISKCVQDQEGRITGYKSHDAHFMMHYLLPISVNTTLNKDVAIPLQRLSNFFRGIWKKVINPKDLDNLHSEIVECLCQFEQIFPPAFFDIMVHLPNHLVEEIKLGGPVASRCMYAIERYLRELKLDVRNKGRPEGSMAEGYLAKECSRLCARYLKRSESSTHNSAKPCVSQSFLPKIGHPVRGKGKSKKKEDSLIMIDQTTWAQAYRYVLFNCDCEEVERYVNEHLNSISRHKKRKWDSAQFHSKDFMVWFKETVAFKLQQGERVPDHVQWLSKGPSYVAKRHTGYKVNGYRFHTMKRDANCVTQNSGVTLTALTSSFASSKDKNPIVGNVKYYGSLDEIIEISYHGHFSVVLFKCVWYHSELDDQFTFVNKNKIIYEGEPFILASQAQQVFYVEDLTRDSWHYAIENVPNELSDGTS